MSNKDDLIDAVFEKWWGSLSTKVRSGEPIEGDLKLMELALKIADELSKNGQLSEQQLAALRRAEAFHAQKLAAIDFNRTALDRWRDYWRNRADASEKFALELAHEGMKYTLALHGAAALTCINGLISNPSTPFKFALGWVIASACFGVALLGFGQILLAHFLSDFSGKVSAKLTNQPSWTPLNAISRWQHSKVVQRRLAIIDVLIYGSMIWFAIYGLIALIIISS